VKASRRELRRTVETLYGAAVELLYASRRAGVSADDERPLVEALGELTTERNRLARKG
jgi:hypothetical protein